MPTARWLRPKSNGSRESCGLRSRQMPDVLHDLLGESLQVVLCGTAVGTASAKAGAYYAHKQNKFWKILHDTGLTPALLSPHQYRELLRHGVGLTDFVKTHSGMDHQIPLTKLAE